MASAPVHTYVDVRMNRSTITPRSLALGALLAVVAVSCGYDGPPDIETARAELPPEFRSEYRIVYPGQDGKSVLELLGEHAEGLETEGYGEDQLVTSINGISAGTRGRYWLYYVNGDPGLVAASRMPTVDGDEIEWLFAR